mgnify:CR=1 FL=1
MPGGNRRGPEGQGPMTGRGLGYCSGNDAPGAAYPRPGRGLEPGFGRGPGRGGALGPGMAWRHGWGAAGPWRPGHPRPPEDEAPGE